MPRYILRIWLDDRPGALGAVASRIGAVKGDLVGIEILERGAGRVIDELIVDLPNDELVDLMAREVQEVDGVDVESIDLEPNPDRDPRIDAIVTAAVVVEQQTIDSVANELAKRVCSDLMANWCVIYDVNQGFGLAGSGESPSDGWLKAFADGLLVNSNEVIENAVENQPSDLSLSFMRNTGIAIIVGRDGHPFRDLERIQLDALARICDFRFGVLSSSALGA